MDSGWTRRPEMSPGDEAVARFEELPLSQQTAFLAIGTIVAAHKCEIEDSHFRDVTRLMLDVCVAEALHETLLFIAKEYLDNRETFAIMLSEFILMLQKRLLEKVKEGKTASGALSALEKRK